VGVNAALPLAAARAASRSQLQSWGGYAYAPASQISAQCHHSPRAYAPGKAIACCQSCQSFSKSRFCLFSPKKT